MAHSQGEDLLVNLPCDPANFSPQDPLRVGDTSDACDQKDKQETGVQGKPWAVTLVQNKIPARARVDLAENLLFRGEWNSAI